MDDENAATSAVAELNGSEINGRHLKVEKSESKGPRKPSQKLFVGNIREGTTNDEMREVFERYCTVIEADVIKNFGFVHIDADAGRAKVNEILRELNGYNLKGSQIRVQLSTSGGRKGDDSRGGMGGGGGGGGMGGGGGRMMGGG
jgi:RNA-binding protein 4